jgi:hypothetical protein
MGFGPLGTSCSLALKIFSCHGNGDLPAWKLPLLRPGEGLTWMALVAVDSLLHVELVLDDDLPNPSNFLEVNDSMLFLFMAPALKVRFLSVSAIVVSEISKRRKKKMVREVR